MWMTHAASWWAPTSPNSIRPTIKLTVEVEPFLDPKGKRCKQTHTDKFRSTHMKRDMVYRATGTEPQEGGKPPGTVPSSVLPLAEEGRPPTVQGCVRTSTSDPPSVLWSRIPSLRRSKQRCTSARLDVDSKTLLKEHKDT